MAYTPREIKDRVAVGDDIFIVEDLGNNRIRLIPAPTHVSEPGTPVNKALLQHMENHLVPPGAIIMWSGSINDIPVGWALCDGSNGTPDLRDRFIVGAGGEYSPGNTGGAKSVTLTVAQMPQHNHSASSSSTGAHTHSISTSSAGSHSHSASSSSTGAHEHDATFAGSFFGHDHVLMGGSGVTIGRATSSNSGSGVLGLSETPASLGVPRITIDTSGDHQHNITVNSAGSHSHSGTAASAGSHSHSITVNNTGSSQPHENRPPYYALCFIMKL